MKAITTKYYGPTNTKGSKIIASDGDGNKVTVGYDHGLNADGNHAAAAKALCEKMNWTSRYSERNFTGLIGGFVKDGMVWVFRESGYEIEL